MSIASFAPQRTASTLDQVTAELRALGVTVSPVAFYGSTHGFPDCDYGYHSVDDDAPANVLAWPATGNAIECCISHAVEATEKAIVDSYGRSEQVSVEIGAIEPPAPVVAVLVEDRASDLEAPTCSAHWKAAVAVVTWEIRGDHEIREPVCAGCCWDVMSTALLSHPFTPPTVTPVDMDVYSAWSVAA